ncbi:unnamed protein product, partial [Prorocentrum cordatum]
VADHLDLPEFCNGVILTPLKALLSTESKLTAPQRGTLLHRHCSCVRLDSLEGSPAFRVNAARAAQSPLALVFAGRCLVPFPALVRPPPGRPVRWGLGGTGRCTGDVYPDGSVFEAEYPRLASAGWGCVAPHPDCLQVVSFCSGPVLDRLQCISAAELIAVMHVLRFAAPPVRMCSDSAFVVDGFHERGRVTATACVAAHAHLWREFWRLVGDWGDGFELSKVKGHAALGDIQHGRATARHKFGNMMADRAAKSAAAFARVPRQRRAQLQARSKVVKTWGDWIGRLSDGLEDCGHPKRHNRGKPRLPRLFVVRNPVPSGIASRVLAAQGQLGDGARKHELVRIALCEGPTVVGCVRCGSFAVSRVAALSQPCPPVATDHALKVLKRLCKREFRLSTKVFRVAAQAPLAVAAEAAVHDAQLE